jgi:hypothetical protein
MAQLRLSPRPEETTDAVGVGQKWSAEHGE